MHSNGSFMGLIWKKSSSLVLPKGTCMHKIGIEIQKNFWFSLVRMIICKRPPHLHDHLQKASPSNNRQTDGRTRIFRIILSSPFQKYHILGVIGFPSIRLCICLSIFVRIWIADTSAFRKYMVWGVPEASILSYCLLLLSQKWTDIGIAEA